MALNLQAFIFRSEALKLYRQFLRTVRSAPPSAQEELLSQIREGFRQNPAPYNDLYAVKYKLSDGRAQLKYLSETLDLQRV